MLRINERVIIILSIFVMVSCSTGPDIIELEQSSDPDEEISILETDIENARSAQIDLLSPQKFERTVKEYESALSSRENGNSKRETLHDISVSRAYLLESQNSSARIISSIPEVFRQRKNAIMADAHLHYKREFDDIDSDLKEMTRDAEKREEYIFNTQMRDSIEDRYNQIEMRAILNINLGPAILINEQAIREGAEKIAPKTLVWGKKRLVENENLLRRNRHSLQIAARVSNAALADAHRLLSVVRSAKNNSSQTSEQTALEIEAIKSVSENRANEAERKINYYRLDLDKSQSDLATSEDKINDKNSQITDLNFKNRELNQKDRLENEYQLATRTFDKSEADVFRQGDDLLLRLKGVEFLNAQSDFKNSSISLLEKVKEIIKNTKRATVVVEGHTDSVGTKSANTKLSIERAKSIENFLTSDKSINTEHISIRGLGDTKPIASNRTAEGRAQNRRVDVVIKSESY